MLKTLASAVLAVVFVFAAPASAVPAGDESRSDFIPDSVVPSPSDNALPRVAQAGPSTGGHSYKPELAAAIAELCDNAGHKADDMSQQKPGTELCAPALQLCRFAGHNPTKSGNPGCFFAWHFRVPNDDWQFGIVYDGDDCNPARARYDNEALWDNCRDDIPPCAAPRARMLNGEIVDNPFAPCVDPNAPPVSAVAEEDMRDSKPLAADETIGLVRGSEDEPKEEESETEESETETEESETEPAPVPTDPMEMFQAIEAGDLERLTAMLDAGLDPRFRLPHPPYFSLLDVAVFTDNAEAAHELMRRGADPNEQNAEGVSALHVAVLSGNAAMARLLLESGADADASGGEAVRISPLHLAARVGDAEMVATLLAFGADAAAAGEFGETALHLAAACDEPAQIGRTGDCAAVIVEMAAAGADMNIRDNNGGTPLHIAVSGNRGELVRALAESGADWNKRDPATGMTILEYAESDRPEMGAILREFEDRAERERMEAEEREEENKNAEEGESSN